MNSPNNALVHYLVPATGTRRHKADVRSQRNMKKWLIILIALVGISISVAIWAFFYESPPVTLDIPDVSQGWEHYHVDREGGWFFRTAAGLNLSVTGRIDGQADFVVTTLPKWKDVQQPRHIGPGQVNIHITEPEWWCNSVFVRYAPHSVSNGNLTVTMNIQ